MKPSVYIETTVVSYLTAQPNRNALLASRQKLTWVWWHRTLPKLDGYISPAVIDEASRGNAEKAKARLLALKSLPLLPVTPEVVKLAGDFERLLQLPASANTDAIHLAVASVSRLDYLVTWNCAHLASARVRKRLSSWGVWRGVTIPVLCTPEELMEV